MLVLVRAGGRCWCWSWGEQRPPSPRHAASHLDTPARRVVCRASVRTPISWGETPGTGSVDAAHWRILGIGGLLWATAVLSQFETNPPPLKRTSNTWIVVRKHRPAALDSEPDGTPATPAAGPVRHASLLKRLGLLRFPRLPRIPRLLCLPGISNRPSLVGLPRLGRVQVTVAGPIGEPTSVDQRFAKPGPTDGWRERVVT